MENSKEQIMENLITASLKVGPVNVLALVLIVSYWIYIMITSSLNRQVETPPAPQSVADFNTTSLYYSAFSNDYSRLRSSFFSTQTTPVEPKKVDFDLIQCNLNNTSAQETAALFRQLGIKINKLASYEGPFQTQYEQVEARRCLIQMAKIFLTDCDDSFSSKLGYTFSFSNPNVGKLDGQVCKLKEEFAN